MTPPRPDALARYAQEFNRTRTLQHWGVTLSFPEGNRVQVLLDPIKPEHRGGMGTEAVNGGVVAAIFDLAIGCTAALIDPSRRSATMQLSMSFERPVRGNLLRAVAQLDSAGKTVAYASARILDEAGQECAHCQGLVRLSQVPWHSGSSPATN